MVAVFYVCFFRLISFELTGNKTKLGAPSMLSSHAVEFFGSLNIGKFTMKKCIRNIFFGWFIAHGLAAQGIYIGSQPQSPDPSAGLEVEFNQ